MEISSSGLLRIFLLLVSMLAASATLGAATPSSLSANNLGEAQIEVKRLLNAGEYDAVIRKLIALRSSSDLATRKFAQEFLGVAREKKGQIEFASLEYKRFLKEFPDAPEASRVRMRLRALVRSTLPDNGRVARSTEPARRLASRRIHGALGVSYRGSQNTSDGGATTTSVSMVGTDIDLTGQAEHGISKMGFRLGAGHYSDLLPGHPNTADRFSYAYVDYGLGESFRVRLGRQRARTRAILGRFDGLNLAYGITDGPEFSLFAGLPADTSKTGLFADNRKFVGVSVNSGGIWSSFRMGMYTLRQTINGIVDRQAVGTEFRYVAEGQIAQAFVDFDTHFHKLNAISLDYNMMNQGQGSLHASYSYQKSPYISTRNALIGQPVDGIEALQQLLTGSDQLDLLALDRSLNSQTATIGVGRSLTKQIRLAASVSWYAVSSGPASGGVPAMPDYRQIYGETHVSFDNFMLESQTLTVGFSYSHQENANVWSFRTSTYYRSGGRLRFSPRFRIDRRTNADGSQQTNLAPSLRVDMGWGQSRLYMQGGYLLYERQFPVLDTQRSSLRFIYIGYQYLL